MKTRIRIEQDSSPENPRDWDNLGDNLGVMYCWHRRYNLGDPHKWDAESFLETLTTEVPAFAQDMERGRDLLDRCPAKYEARVKIWIDTRRDKALGDFVIIPLYLYDHSGLAIQTEPFSCGWDSGQVGWVVGRWEAARSNWSLGEDDTWETLIPWDGETITVREGMTRNLTAEVETYNKFLQGDIWGYVVESSSDGETWEHEESCWGYYDRADAVADGETMREHIQNRLETKTRRPLFQINGVTVIPG